MKISETIRDDGLHIVTCKVPSKKTYVELIAKVGSAYDPPDQHGLFHYFEHMAFKGTSKRTAEDIRSFSSRNILDQNALTDRLETRYYGESVRRKFPLLCEFLCDLYFNSIFPEKEMNREREVISNEIIQYMSKDVNVAFSKMIGALWSDNPLREYGAGAKEELKNINRSLLLSTKSEWYIPSNTIAIATGDVNHDEFVSELNKHIKMNFNIAPRKSWENEYNILPRQPEIVINRPRENAIIILGCKFPEYDVDKMVASRLLQNIIMGGQGSILFKELRGKRGLIYNIFGNISIDYGLGGYFWVVAEMLPNRIHDVRNILSSVLFEPINDTKIFDETKENMCDLVSLGYDDIDDWADLIYKIIKQKKPVKSAVRYFQRYSKTLASITLDEVEKLRKNTLKPERFVTVIVKPQ